MFVLHLFSYPKSERTFLSDLASDPEIIATPMSRLNEALAVSCGAMSAENPQAVERIIRLKRELDRFQRVNGRGRGTETRRNLLKALNSGAEKRSSALRRRFPRPGASRA